MDDHRLRALESRLSDIERKLGDLAARFERVEQPGAPAPPTAEQPSAIAVPAGDGTGDGDDIRQVLGLPTLIGRTSLVLCGAYLLRYLTESGTVSTTVGIGLGLVYSAAWLLLADRAAAHDRHLSGAFHAVTASIIAFPLVWEATDRLKAITPPVGAGLLALFTAAGLVVAWRRSFRTVTWVTVIFVLVTGIGLLFRTRDVTAFGVLLLALAIGSLVVAYGRGWRLQRWVVAVVLDLLVLMLTAGHLKAGRMEWLEAGPLLVLQVGLAVVYLAAFGLRLYVQERFVTKFAMLQGLLVWIIGFEGAVLVGGARTDLVLGSGALVAAVLAVAAAARVLSRHPSSAAMAFGYFSTVGTVAAAEGLRLLLPRPAVCFGWCGIALVLAALGLARRRAVLQALSALLLLGASIGCGLFAATAGTFVAPSAGPWPAWSTPALVVLVFLLGACVVLYRAASVTSHPAATVARVGLLFLGVTIIAGLAARLLAGALASAPGPEADAARLAVARMAAITVIALALAATHAMTRRPEMAWLFYAVLVLGGAKIVLEDLRTGRPAMAAVSLGLYGLALVVGAHLTRQGSKPPPGAEPRSTG